MNNIVEIINAKKIYKMGEFEVAALNGVNLTIKKGEFVAIMGPSGSGKTTLLNLMGALDRPTDGSILIEGVDISELDDDELAKLRNQKIGFIFQFFNLISRMTALDNVALPMAFAGISRDQRRRRAEELLKMVNLGDRVTHKPTELSGGQQQRVAIARALGNNPSVVLCDEVTGNLDTKTGKEILDLLRTLNEEQGQTFIIVTHDPLVADCVDRIISLQDGIIVKDELKVKNRA
jgi:putative ABC transport system ATP-binding protein